jgi:hypothetical protein
MPALSESCYVPISFLCAHLVVEKTAAVAKGRIFPRFDINLPLLLTKFEAIASQSGRRYNFRE